LISVALYTFIIAWVEFVFSLIILGSKGKMTVVLKLGSMVSGITVHWDKIRAGAVKG